MGILLRHRGCQSLIAASEQGWHGNRSSYGWLLRTKDGEMRRPMRGSADRAYCPDCGQHIFPWYRLTAPFTPRAAT